MANEEKKDFNAMLHDSKDMPKIQVITDKASIEKYGGDRMYFAPPADYDEVMKKFLSERSLQSERYANISRKSLARTSQSRLRRGSLFLLRRGRVISGQRTKPPTGGR